MPPKNRFAELLPEITAWRRDFHEHPELLFEVHRTAAKVAELCRSFGCDEVVEGIGRTGVVAVIKGKTDTAGRVVRQVQSDFDGYVLFDAVPYGDYRLRIGAASAAAPPRSTRHPCSGRARPREPGRAADPHSRRWRLCRHRPPWRPPLPAPVRRPPRRAG